MDVRITFASAPSNIAILIEKLYQRNEEEKRTKYNSRVINTKQATFVPLQLLHGQTRVCSRSEWIHVNLWQIRQMEFFRNRRRIHRGLFQSLPWTLPESAADSTRVCLGPKYLPQIRKYAAEPWTCLSRKEI